MKALESRPEARPAPQYGGVRAALRSRPGSVAAGRRMAVVIAVAALLRAVYVSPGGDPRAGHERCPGACGHETRLARPARRPLSPPINGSGRTKSGCRGQPAVQQEEIVGRRSLASGASLRSGSSIVPETTPGAFDEESVYREIPGQRHRPGQPGRQPGVRLEFERPGQPGLGPGIPGDDRYRLPVTCIPAIPGQRYRRGHPGRQPGLRLESERPGQPGLDLSSPLITVAHVGELVGGRGRPRAEPSASMRRIPDL